MEYNFARPPLAAKLWWSAAPAVSARFFCQFIPLNGRASAQGNDALAICRRAAVPHPLVGTPRCPNAPACAAAYLVNAVGAARSPQPLHHAGLRRCTFGMLPASSRFLAWAICFHLLAQGALASPRSAASYTPFPVTRAKTLNMGMNCRQDSNLRPTFRFPCGSRAALLCPLSYGNLKSDFPPSPLAG